MATINTILWDVGGVLLTNGWDHKERAAVLSHFGVDRDAFEQRHPEPNDSWEKGLLTVDEYLQKTVFYEPRDFSAAEFVDAMRAESRVLNDSALGIVRELASSNSLLLATVNNEARELNDYRVDTFRLRDYFKAFFSSCYVGLRKPAPQIYKLALGVLQRDAASVAFVDDRSGNVEAAKAVGIHGIVYQGAEQLRLEFERLGIFPGVTA